MSAIAIMGVLALAAASVYLFPSFSARYTSLGMPNKDIGTAVIATTGTMRPIILITTTQNYAMSTSTLMGSTTNYLAENTTVTFSSGWDAALVMNLTLNSPQVQSYVRNAYSYYVECCSSSSPPPFEGATINAFINVTGSQTVSGNWTSSYFVSYSGIEALAVDVQFTAPSTYQLTSINATSLPGWNYSVVYTPQQQRVIDAALSNDSVRGDMANDGISAYYVANVTIFPTGNSTFGRDYFLTINQIDGPKFIGVFVNPNTMQVTGAYEDSTASYVCYGYGICFSSPWGSLPETITVVTTGALPVTITTSTTYLGASPCSTTVGINSTNGTAAVCGTTSG